MPQPRILVTGGSGYLGEWIVTLACPAWDVTATYLHHPPAPNGDDLGVTWRRLDVRDGTARPSSYTPQP